ncbi:unnamed protein product, partial [Gulo gulo]
KGFTGHRRGVRVPVSLPGGPHRPPRSGALQSPPRASSLVRSETRWSARYRLVLPCQAEATNQRRKQNAGEGGAGQETSR